MSDTLDYVVHVLDRINFGLPPTYVIHRGYDLDGNYVTKATCYFLTP